MSVRIVTGFECLFADLTGVHDHRANSHADGVSIVGLDPTSTGRKPSADGAVDKRLNGCRWGSLLVRGK